MISLNELSHEVVEEHRHWLLNNAGDANEVDACRQYFDQRLGARRRIEAKERICASINRRRHADTVKREASQVEAAATGRSIDPTLVAAAVPKMIEVKLTHNDAWVVLRALAAYDAKDEKAPDAKTWIAERLLRLLQPAVPQTRADNRLEQPDGNDLDTSELSEQPPGEVKTIDLDNLEQKAKAAIDEVAGPPATYFIPSTAAAPFARRLLGLITCIRELRAGLADALYWLKPGLDHRVDEMTKDRDDLSKLLDKEIEIP